jgi:tagaturonate reductase
MRETILQFGGGKFLRSFVDVFVHEANERGREVGRVVVVQSSKSPRAEWLNAQGGCYHLLTRGLVDGETVDHKQQISSVSRALVAGEAWEEVLAVARSQDLKWIVSNSTEAGFALEEGDELTAPRSFPAKLTAVLYARFASGGSGLAILPCELIEDNGRRLLELVQEQAVAWDLDAAFSTWLAGECLWPNTLVDRIVSTPPAGHPLLAEDPLLAIAEPYSLWAVEALKGLELFAHEAIELVADVEPYALRKVRLLNGAHTALACRSLHHFATVREALADQATRDWLERLLFEELVPVVDERVAGAAAFARETMDRFANPFLDHRLEDIAAYHEAKVGTRLLPTYRDYQAQFDKEPPLLQEIIAPYL